MDLAAVEIDKRGGANIQVDLTLSFDEAVFGVQKLEIYKTTVCSTVRIGLGKGGKMIKCSACGYGRQRVRQQTFFGIIETNRFVKHVRAKDKNRKPNVQLVTATV